MSQKPQAHAHKLIYQTAREAAEQLYEVIMGDNKVRAEWKRQNPEATERQLLARFVAKNTAKCLPFARATLAQMLTTSISEQLKETIHEALCLDWTLVRGRTSAPVSNLINLPRRD